MEIFPLTQNRDQGSDTSNAADNATWTALTWRIDPAGSLSRTFLSEGTCSAINSAARGMVEPDSITQIANNRHERIVESQIKDLLKKPNPQTGRFNAVKYIVEAIYNQPSNAAKIDAVTNDPNSTHRTANACCGF
ncbi:MAG: hypothetical protein H6574_18755 [Lewinellaceae bacterium]|nr:hypothetical protein [Lewinellaceae bacterium]